MFGEEDSNFETCPPCDLLAHETAHVLAAFALGAHPTIAFDKGRPTVFSGIDIDKHPHKQFVFSALGLTTQAVINELMLDVRPTVAHLWWCVRNPGVANIPRSELRPLFSEAHAGWIGRRVLVLN